MIHDVSRTASASIAWANELPMVREPGMECYDIGPDSATFSLAGDRFAANPDGAVNGGIVVAAADQVMGVLGAMAAPQGQLPATGLTDHAISSTGGRAAHTSGHRRVDRLTCHAGRGRRTRQVGTAMHVVSGFDDCRWLSALTCSSLAYRRGA